MSLARQNLSKECEAAVNGQIAVELGASYAYLSMYAWLSRDTVALHGLAKYFKKQSEGVRRRALCVRRCYERPLVAGTASPR